MAIRALSGAVLAGVVLVTIVTLVGSARAARGDLDRSFAGDGVAELSSDTRLLDAAVQRNGKLVAVGEQGQEAGKVRLLVARFNPNGSLDQTFSPSAPVLPLLGSGGGGTYLGPADSIGRAVAIQRDGKILVAGGLTDPTGSAPRGMFLLRLRPNGTLDKSFGGGRATALKNRRGDARAIALRGRRIVIAGSASLPSTGDAFDRVAVVSFKANGSRDRSFGAGGTKVIDFGRISVANAIAVRGDGKIVLAGSQRANLQSTNLLVARLTARGRRDRGFSRDGLFLRQYAHGAAYSAAFGVVLASHGRVVIGGAATSASSGADAIAIRLRARGRPDRRFSGDGVAYLRAAKDRDQFTKQEPFPGAHAVALSGKTIVLAGYYDNLGLKKLAVWALRGNGSLDRGFGKRGRTVTSAGPSAQLNGVAASSRRIYGVGDIDNLVDPPRALAVRYRGAGS